MKITGKLMPMGVGGVVGTAAALVCIGAWQSGVYARHSTEEVKGLVDRDLDDVAKGVFNLVRSQDEAIQEKVTHNLNTIRYVQRNRGGVSLSSDTVKWHAVDQFTRNGRDVVLPKMMVGGEWLGQVKSGSSRALVVDETKDLVGSVATVSQRMSPRGDMLRVATNVLKPDGARAIGTYIPAVKPDGTPNPVVETLLSGKTYRENAFVVDGWYVTAYEPIVASNGKVVGALFAGVKQQSNQALRDAIPRTAVGESGYVFVLGGNGDERGKYIFSQGGKRDGENVWEAEDTGGRKYVQDIVNRALKLNPGDMATVNC